MQLLLRTKTKLLWACVSAIQLQFYVVIQTHAAILQKYLHILLALIWALLANIYS